MHKSLFFKKIGIRFSHWEYWNSTLVYFPIMPYLLFLMIRSRNFFFFRGANPGIEFGGFTMESKWKIQETVNHNFFPKTYFIEKGKEIDSELMQQLEYPIIVKPDIGGKGRAVKQINSLTELNHYHKNCPVSYLIQEKISYQNEIGLFYVKHPQEKEGKITGIVSKKFIAVVGDGNSTVRELILKEPRFILQYDKIVEEYDQDFLDQQLKRNQQLIISEIGNHSQGSEFTDCSFKISDKLTQTMNEIASNFPGFYFGRFDIRFDNWEALENKKYFSIIEVNGAGSEPTHIYDQNHSLFFAWKEIVRHWNLIYTINKANNRTTVCKMSFKEGVLLLLNHYKIMRKLDRFSVGTFQK